MYFEQMLIQNKNGLFLPWCCRFIIKDTGWVMINYSKRHFGDNDEIMTKLKM